MSILVQVTLQDGTLESFVDPVDATVLDSGALRIVHENNKSGVMFGPTWWRRIDSTTIEEESHE